MASRKMNEDVAYARNTESGCKVGRNFSIFAQPEVSSFKHARAVDLFRAVNE